MSKLATSSPVPTHGGSNNNKMTSTVQTESTNAWSRTASSNIRSATNAKPTTATTSITSNNTAPSTSGLPVSKHIQRNNAAEMETDATLYSLRDRFLHLTLNLIGQIVQVTLTDGSVVEGVLHTFTPFRTSTHPDPGFNSQLNKYVLKYVRVVHAATHPPDIQKGHTLILPMDKVSHLFAKNVRLVQNPEIASIATAAAAAGGRSTVSTFRTDTDISSSRKDNNGRESQDFVLAGSAWTAAPTSTISSSIGGEAEDSASTPDTDTRSSNSTDVHSGRKGLFGTAYLPGSNNNTNNNHRQQQLQNSGVTDPLKGSIGTWDQFSANEKLYGVKATFDENLYTTVLNVDSIDKTKREQAERLAREIESQTTSNIHLAEERGQFMETDFDEEDLYSGVLKKDNTIQTMDGTKKERTKLTLLARTKEQGGATTISADGDIMGNVVLTNNNGNKTNSGNDESPLNHVPTTSVTPTESRVTPATISTTAVPEIIVVSSNKDGNPTAKSTPTSAPTNIAQSQPKVPMNYAAAAAKGDAKYKNSQASTTATASSMPPKKNITESISITSGAGGTSSGVMQSDVESTIKATSKLYLDGNHSEGKNNVNSTSDDALSSKVTADSLDDKDFPTSSKNGNSKLNANAKEFTFNPDAKSFTPTFTTNVASPMSAPIQQLEPDPQQFMGIGPYNPYMQHPAMPMMYPYPAGGMRYYPQGGTAANAPYVMMPTNAYMSHPPSQPMSVLSPRAAHEIPVSTEGVHDGLEKTKDTESRGTSDIHSSNEGQGEGVGESLEEATQQSWEQQQTSNAMGGVFPATPGNSVYYPGGGGMSLHPSQPYGHMIPPPLNPMVQGHGGFNIVYNVPSHIHQGPGMAYGQMRSHPVAYSSAPYIPYSIVAPSGAGPIEGGAGRGRGGIGGINHSSAGGRAPRRASGGRGSNAGGRSGVGSGGSNQGYQGALRTALGNSTRYYPPGMVESDNLQYDTGDSSSPTPYSESVTEPSSDEPHSER